MHTIDQKVEEIKPTKVKRTKPRTVVSTTFEVFTFKPPDSEVYEESETKTVISTDDEGISEKAIEIDKMEVENAGQ